MAESTLEGLTLDTLDDATRAAALDQAFDYRGDVTLELTDGRVVTGYVFDRRRDQSPPTVRLILPDGADHRLTLRYDEVRRLIFSGRDPAVGKSFETWVRKYLEKHRAS